MPRPVAGRFVSWSPGPKPGSYKETGGVPIKWGEDHFPDTYKQPGHETFSEESKYAEELPAGHWEGEAYMPPPVAPVVEANPYEFVPLSEAEQEKFKRGQR